MVGLSYIVDEKGRKRAVIVDLKRHGDLWEDLYDAMIAEEREGEERLDWESVRHDKPGARRRKG